jgi:hypothetical protein
VDGDGGWWMTVDWVRGLDVMSVITNKGVKSQPDYFSRVTDIKLR